MSVSDKKQRVFILLHKWFYAYKLKTLVRVIKIIVAEQANHMSGWYQKSARLLQRIWPTATAYLLLIRKP